MKLNQRARKKVIDDLLPGERIEAMVLLANQIGTGSASSDGAMRQASTALATPYACDRGIDFDNPALRAELVNSWLTVTGGRLLFHKPKATSVRPTPGALITTVDRAGVRLNWFDVSGLGLSNRVVHFEFPDGGHVLSATMLKATLRRKPFTDEPFLLVETFGDEATNVSPG